MVSVFKTAICTQAEMMPPDSAKSKVKDVDVYMVGHQSHLNSVAVKPIYQDTEDTKATL